MPPRQARHLQGGSGPSSWSSTELPSQGPCAVWQQLLSASVFSPVQGWWCAFREIAHGRGSQGMAAMISPKPTVSVPGRLWSPSSQVLY